MKNHFHVLVSLLIFLSSCTKQAVQTEAEKAAPSPTPTPFGAYNPQNGPFMVYQILAKSPQNVNFFPSTLKNAATILHQEAESSNKKKFEPFMGNPASAERSDHYQTATSVWLKERRRALSAEALNQWITKNTCGTFTDQYREMNPKTSSVVLSAFCFQGKWAKPFLKSDSTLAHFQSSPHLTETATMMRKESTYRYFEDENSQWLELTFQNSPVALWLALPKKRFDLQKTEANLGLDYLKLVGDKMEKEKVDVVLPKVKLSQKLSLIEVMNLVGGDFAFNKSAYAKSSKFFKSGISEVSQISAFNIDENGVNFEDSVATESKDESTISLFRSKKFHADQPFLAILKNLKSDELLLLGKVHQP